MTMATRERTLTVNTRDASHEGGTDMSENEHLNSRRCLFTNADRIRAMSDEELANVLSWLNDQKTADGWLDWLRQNGDGTT